MVEKKHRLDEAVMAQGLADTKDRAKALITSGLIRVNGEKADQSASLVLVSDEITIKGKKLPYVSRGGLKLEKAMQSFPITLFGKICADIGASTGGFTDCMLQNGAEKVYAIDVGYGQLAWKLRQDLRVVNLERTNIRHVTRAEIPDFLDFVSIDVSFISLKQVLPMAHQLLNLGGEVVALIKPQFEAAKDEVETKGVVRDPIVHGSVIEEISTFAATHRFKTKGLTYSPVRGPEGNIEYLLFLEKADENYISFSEKEIEQVVNQSHQSL